MKITVGNKSFNVPRSWASMTLYARQNYLRDTNHMKEWVEASAQSRQSRIREREGKPAPYLAAQLEHYPTPWWQKL